MRSPSVSAQVLALVVVPLALQLGLLLWMARLQSEAENQLKVTEHNRKVADSLNRLHADIFGMVASVGHRRQLESSTDQYFQSMITRAETTYRELEDLTRDQPELNKNIREIEAAERRAFAVAEKIRLTPDLLSKERLWVELSYLQQDVIYARLWKMSQRMEAIAREDSDAQMTLRGRFQKVGLFGGAITVAATALIGLGLATSISLRLKRLSENNLRLAARHPLLEQMQGDDEIATIDKTFHDMAKALEESSRKERAVIENARDLICTVEQNRFSAVNPACKELLGYEIDELLGARVADYLAESEDASLNFLANLKSGHEATEIRMRRKGGHIIDTLWSTQWSQKEKSTFCVVHDISERRAAERLKQEILHMVSHDLRTPLSTLGNIFHLLNKENSDNPEKQKQYVQLGERNVDRLILLVNDLLDIEKIRSGQMSIEKAPVSLDECFGVCQDSVSAIAENRGVKVELPPTKVLVSGDGDKIDRILINLVANAIRYSPAGGVVDVTTETTGKDVQITVTDHGKGIPSDELENIFERFHQVHGDQNLKGSSGLGLAICRALVQLHGGRIWVESTVGKGTSFSFTLPLATS